MIVNADCKIQNKIKSFACGQTSNVGHILHMVKCNAKHNVLQWKQCKDSNVHYCMQNPYWKLEFCCLQNVRLNFNIEQCVFTQFCKQQNLASPAVKVHKASLAPLAPNMGTLASWPRLTSWSWLPTMKITIAQKKSTFLRPVLWPGAGSDSPGPWGSILPPPL